MPPSPPTYSVLLTPPGAGAIAVIRVAGTDAIEIVNRVFRPIRQKVLSSSEPNRLRYGRIVDDAGPDIAGPQVGVASCVGSQPSNEESIDDVIACVVNYATTCAGLETATPIVEICTHGGVRVIERILQLLDRHGAPLMPDHDDDACGAPPGSNALPHISIAWPTASLIEREADEQLMVVRTERAVRFLAYQRYALPRAIEALVDVVEDEPERVVTALRAMVEHYESARMLIEGATIAIVGPPNSGKSTLFNRLSGRNAAIVSPSPGTTRDWVEAAIEIEGVPVALLDTAGEHQTMDELERAAIDAGRRIGAAARLFLLVFDGTVSPPAWFVQKSGWRTLLDASERPEVLLVVNKLDQPTRWNLGELKPYDRTGDESASACFALSSADKLAVSAKTGEGLEQLIHRVAESLGQSGWNPRGPCVFVDRQRRNISDILSLPITDIARMSSGLLELMGCSPDLTAHRVYNP